MSQRNLTGHRSLALRVVVVLTLLGLLTAGQGIYPAPIQAESAADPEQLYIPLVDSATNSGRIYLPLIANVRPACSSRVAPSLFGLQMYNDTSPASPYYTHMKNSGAAWVRAPIAWGRVEPTNTTPANYNWSTADRVIGAMREGCMNMIITHVGAPGWAATASEGPIDKTPLSEFGQYIKALVERYDGDGFNDAPGSPKIEYFEFYNEPDEGAVPGGGRWGDDGDKYAAMLREARRALKEANPNAKVVFGGIAYDWFEDDPVEPGPFRKEFLDDVLAAGGGAHFDIMAYHFYPLFGNRWTGANGVAGDKLGLRSKTKAIRDKLAAAGYPNKPIFITEMGWHSDDQQPTPWGSPEYQARFVVELFAESLAANVPMSIWFSLHDLGDYPFENGLVTEAATPAVKPAYGVYQVAVAQLSPLRYIRTWSKSETGSGDLIVHEFRDDQASRDVYVAWSHPIDTQTSHPFRVQTRQATLYDMFGTATVLKDGEDGRNDGYVTIQVGGRPVYVHVDGR